MLVHVLLDFKETRRTQGKTQSYRNSMYIAKRACSHNLKMFSIVLQKWEQHSSLHSSILVSFILVGLNINFPMISHTITSLIIFLMQS